MSGEDRRDRAQAMRIAVGLIVLATAWIIAAVVMVSGWSDLHAGAATGLGWRDGAVVAFLLSTTLMLAFAFLADPGILGELPTMIIGFLVLFTISWPLLVLLF